MFGCEETDRVSVVVLRLVFQPTTRRASRCLVLREFSSLVPTEPAQHLLSSVHRSVWPVVTACQTWFAGRKTPPAFPQLAKVNNRDRSNPRLEHRAQGLTPTKPACGPMVNGSDASAWDTATMGCEKDEAFAVTRNGKFKTSCSNFRAANQQAH